MENEAASVPPEVRVNELSALLDESDRKLRSAQWRVEYLEEELQKIADMSKDMEHDLFSATEVAKAALAKGRELFSPTQMAKAALQKLAEEAEGR